MTGATIGALSGAAVAIIGAITALIAQIRHVNGPAHRGIRPPGR